MLEQIFQAVGYVVVGGGVLVSLTFWIFKLFGERWLNHTFSTKLEAFRHEHERNMEQVRFEIAKLTDRTIKLHQKEFEVLPEIWAKVLDAYHKVGSVTSPFQSYPDLDKMTAPALEDFLTRSSLPAWTQDEIRAASRKTDAYINAVTHQRITEAHQLSRLALQCLKRNGIFIPESLFDLIDDFLNIIFEALEEFHLEVTDPPTPRVRTARTRLVSEGSAKYTELLHEVRGRMGAHQ